MGSFTKTPGSNLDSGLTMVYQEGSNHGVHKEDPEYYLTQVRAREFATNYIKSLKDGQAPHPIMIEKAGIRQNKKGQWVYRAKQSKIANPITLADYAVLPLKNIFFGSDNPGRTKSVVAKGIRLGDGILEPHNIIGPDWKNGDIDEEGNLPTFKAGQYSGRCDKCYGKGCNTCQDGIKQYIANPLRWMGQAQFESENSYDQLIRRGITRVKDYFDAAKSNALRQEGRRVTENDPLPPGAPESKYHGLPKGQDPYHLHLQIDPVVHNMAEYHEIDPDQLPKQLLRNGTSRVNPQLRKQMEERLEEAKTATFVKCNCPHCVINQSVQPMQQYIDTQHHDAIIGSGDPDVLREYFKSFPVGESTEFGKLKDFGKVGKKHPHRIVWGEAGPRKLIRQAVKFNQEESNYENYQGAPRIRKTKDVGAPTDKVYVDPEAIKARSFE